MSSAETGAVSTGPLGRFSSSTRAWNRRRMPTPRICSRRFIGSMLPGPVVTCGQLRRSTGFGALLDPAQHPASHDEVGRDDRGEVGRDQPPRSHSAPDSQLQPSSAPAQLNQPKAPRPVEVGTEPLPLVRRQVGRRMQDQRVRRVDFCHHKLGGARWAVWDSVPNLQIALQDGVEVVQTRPVLREHNRSTHSGV